MKNCLHKLVNTLVFLNCQGTDLAGVPENILHLK
jgi:hypothetical protein